MDIMEANNGVARASRTQDKYISSIPPSALMSPPGGLRQALSVFAENQKYLSKVSAGRLTPLMVWYMVQWVP